MRGAIFRQAPKGSGGTPARLLPGVARPMAVVLAGLCLVVTALLGVLFAHQTGPDWLDAGIDAGAQAVLGGQPRLIGVLTWPGGSGPVIGMTVALALVCAARRYYRETALVIISVPAATMLTELLLKPLIGRTLWGSLSYPSGHSTGAFALAAAVTILLIGRPGAVMPRALRVLLALTAFLAAAAVAFAMIAAGLHYFTDTVAGAATGVGTVLLTALVLDLLGSLTQRYRGRSMRTDPVPGHDAVGPGVSRRP